MTPFSPLVEAYLTRQWLLQNQPDRAPQEEAMSEIAAGVIMNGVVWSFVLLLLVLP
jgi:hypothetical protein